MNQEQRLDTVVLFKRKDGKWEWHRINGYSGDIVSTSGNQGYENKADMQAVLEGMFDKGTVHYVTADEREVHE